MLKQCFRNSYKIKTFVKSISQYSTLEEKWDLHAAICLERKPIITPNLSNLEQEFHKMLAEVEVEKSVKSDFEVRNENDM